MGSNYSSCIRDYRFQYPPVTLKTLYVSPVITYLFVMFLSHLVNIGFSIENHLTIDKNSSFMLRIHEWSIKKQIRTFSRELWHFFTAELASTLSPSHFCHTHNPDNICIEWTLLSWTRAVFGLSLLSFDTFPGRLTLHINCKNSRVTSDWCSVIWPVITALWCKPWWSRRLS